MENEEVKKTYDKIVKMLEKKYGYTYYDYHDDPYWFDEQSGRGYTISIELEDSDVDWGHDRTAYYTDIVISYGNPPYGLWLS